MTSRSGPPPIVYIVAVVALGVGGWLAYNNFRGSGSQPVTTSAPTDSNNTATTVSNSNQPAADIDTSLPNPTVLEMDGSVSMVKLMQEWRNIYAQKFPNIPTTYGIPDKKPNGSSAGLKNLIDGKATLVASSRPLKPEEASSGIKVIPVAIDAIAVVVGVDNPFRGSLTMNQLAQIYKGQITNWSEVGGPNLPIKVYNRSPDGGTSELFKNKVLVGDSFAPEGPNFETEKTDNTTLMLQKLGKDGIGYASVSQVANQKTIRVLDIENTSPLDIATIQDGRYPLSRQVFLAHPAKTSMAIKQFIDVALSPEGQQVVEKSGFIPLQ